MSQEVSVVIPLHNKARHIGRAIESVLRQTFQRFEVIVVDDGSTDGGADVVRKFDDPRIRLVVQQNAGVSAARNRGIEQASCECVAFLDADDEWLPVFLETVTGLRTRHPEAGLFACAYRICREATTWAPAFQHCVESPEGGLLDDYFHAALGPAPVWTSATMAPKAVLKQFGGFPVGMRTGEDLNLWMQIALRYHVAWSPRDGAIYHLSADNRACTSVPLSFDITCGPVWDDFCQSGAEPVVPRASVEEYVAYRRIRHAIAVLFAGRRDWALSLFWMTRNTRLYRKDRRRLGMALLVPTPILRLGLRCKDVIRMLPRHRSRPETN